MSINSRRKKYRKEKEIGLSKYRNDDGALLMLHVMIMMKTVVTLMVRNLKKKQGTIERRGNIETVHYIFSKLRTFFLLACLKCKIL